jgi:hypothetical protein
MSLSFNRYRYLLKGFIQMNKWLYRFLFTLLTVLTLLLGSASALSATSSHSHRFHPFGRLHREDVQVSGTIHLVTKPGGWHRSVISIIRMLEVGFDKRHDLPGIGCGPVRLARPSSSIQSVQSFRLISRGSDSNLLVQVLYHITVDANGEVTAPSMRSTCSA